jgi:hypothetical protein
VRQEAVDPEEIMALQVQDNIQEAEAEELERQAAIHHKMVQETRDLFNKQVDLEEMA